MNVLVTGHKGFIGRNLVERTGWDGVDKEECNIRDLGQVYDALAGYDTVIHLAAVAGVKQSITEEEYYVDNNIAGTFNVAYACWDLGIRLIFASSSSVYEAKSPYARTKQGCEDIIGAFQRHGLNGLILRFFTVFGEYNREDMAVHKFTQAIRNNDSIELYGDCKRDWTYVGDLCEAIEKLSKMKLTGTYDLGFGESIPVSGMVEALERVMGDSTSVQRKPQRSFDAETTRANPELMSRLTDKTPLDEALRRTVETI